MSCGDNATPPPEPVNETITEVATPPVPSQDIGDVAATPVIPTNKLSEVPSAPLRILVIHDREEFIKTLHRDVETIDFDDLDVTTTDPVEFASTRYEKQGIIIQGEQGQYAGTHFLYPRNYRATSGQTMYAPGPTAPKEGAATDGGNTTKVEFVSGNAPALVAGFGAMFIDANYPGIAESGLEVFDSSGEQLASESGFQTGTGGHAFIGMIAVDSSGRPCPGIASARLTNGSGWPEVYASEGVTLDDFTYSRPQKSATSPSPDRGIAESTRRATPDSGPAESDFDSATSASDPAIAGANPETETSGTASGNADSLTNSSNPAIGIKENTKPPAGPNKVKIPLALRKPRMWTDRRGATIKASLTGCYFEAGTIYLEFQKVASGRQPRPGSGTMPRLDPERIPVQLTDLIPSDQQSVQRFLGEQLAAAERKPPQHHEPRQGASPGGLGGYLAVVRGSQELINEVEPKLWEIYRLDESIAYLKVAASYRRKPQEHFQQLATDRQQHFEQNYGFNLRTGVPVLQKAGWALSNWSDPVDFARGLELAALRNPDGPEKPLFQSMNGSVPDQEKLNRFHQYVETKYSDYISAHLRAERTNRQVEVLLELSKNKAFRGSQVDLANNKFQWEDDRRERHEELAPLLGRWKELQAVRVNTAPQVAGELQSIYPDLEFLAMTDLVRQPGMGTRELSSFERGDWIAVDQRFQGLPNLEAIYNFRSNGCYPVGRVRFAEEGEANILIPADHRRQMPPPHARAFKETDGAYFVYDGMNKIQVWIKGLLIVYSHEDALGVIEEQTLLDELTANFDLNLLRDAVARDVPITPKAN